MRWDTFRLRIILLILVISTISLALYASDSRKPWTREQDEAMYAAIEQSKSESKKLQKIEPNDVESMRILLWNTELDRRYNPKGESFDRETIEGLLTLFKNSQPYADYDESYAYIKNFDYIFEVKLKNGEKIDVPYSDEFMHPTPFGNFRGYKSVMLKQVLYALIKGLRGNIIYFKDGKVLEITEFVALDVQRRANKNFPESIIHLNKDGQLILYLKITKNDKVIIQDSRPVKYGDFLSYNYDGGYVLIDIFRPYPQAPY